MFQVGQARMLKFAFALGVVTDALAVLPMPSPDLARMLWGFSNESGPYRFAMGYAASLMLGWTGLLIWAFMQPIARRFVALLTIAVITGLVITELESVQSGDLAPVQMIPTWCLQAVLLGFFAVAYFYPIRHLKVTD
jgi:hypothetical protein